MRYVSTLAALGLLMTAGAANAQVSTTWTIASDYDLRGNSQSATDPALQASIDYAAQGGFYIGAWASNIDFGDALDADYEVDLYGGFARTYESGWGWDAGAIYYSYPGESDLDYVEVYGAVSYDWFKTKLSYSPAFNGDAAEALARELTGDDAVSAWYLEANAAIPLPGAFSLLLHAGLSTGDYWDNAFGDDQIDYSVALGYTVGNYQLAAKYVDTDGDVKVTDDVFNNEGRFIFTVATKFPWRPE